MLTGTFSSQSGGIRIWMEGKWEVAEYPTDIPLIFIHDLQHGWVETFAVWAFKVGVLDDGDWGVGISADALYRAAAKLPRVDISRPRKVIGKNTVDNIQSGLFFGYRGLVDGILEAMIREMGGEPTIIATGGLGGIFQAESKYIAHYDPDLTLTGLQILAESNQAPREGGLR